MKGRGDRRVIARGALVAVASAALAAGSIGCGGGSAATVAGCKQVDAPQPKQVSLPAPKQTVKRGETLTAVVQTSCGSFEIELATERAPKTANSFAYLARQGFYNGLDFYRVISGFAIYAGDPLGNGHGGPGYSLEEQPPSGTAYRRGVVAMEKELGQPSGYSGSAFFIATSAETGLPPEYALLGKVSKGYGTVARINKLGTTEEKPKFPILIEEVTIEKG